MDKKELEERFLEVYRRYYYWQELGRALQYERWALGSQYGDAFEAELGELVEDLGHDVRALFLTTQTQARAAAEKICNV